MVPGIRIVGSQVRDCEVVLDGSFRPCPTAQAAGIPLFVKRDAFPGPESSLYLSVRLMTEPRSGFAPMDWQYGGIMGPAPAVVAARTDGVPFTPAGWEVLDNFIDAMFSDGPRLVNREDMLRFLSEAQLALADVSESLALQYPKNAQVIPKGLTVAALNGVVGTVTGRYENGRVGVHFREPFGLKALRPDNLVLQRQDIAVSTMSGETWSISGPFADISGLRRAIAEKLEVRVGDMTFDVLQGDVHIESIADVSCITGPLTVVVTGERNFLEDMWDNCDGQEQPDDAPVGEQQWCYWTEGTEIHRVKQADGTWKYNTESE
ncbi:unnamed protein product [Polarella glacialis]|uniref:Uncharacterized protein n=1 Tax=Polarella glacialis TaxID=89957 RepID=A0A813JZC4_POLGL|nr:unnamed protein product [Polarella glacialis]